ncbi:MAG TPA: AbrB/MazE/SpoVT family DNA-binding domain-containing protein [Candidatus Methanoperedens sp.]|nr:AbrB/MazE/SpoVT family DNA-binding domain-containing protein [Candidatus Methanoperedens sp.]
MDKIRKVIKTGNSLALTLPNKVIKSFDIKEGDLAQYKVKSSKTSITYTFTGHPRQLSLGYVKE